MSSVAHKLRPATLRPMRKHGVAGVAAFIVRVTNRRFDGFVAAAGGGVLELTGDRKRAWGFTSETEARAAVNLALGLGAADYQVAITTIAGGQG